MILPVCGEGELAVNRLSTIYGISMDDFNTKNGVNASYTNPSPLILIHIGKFIFYSSLKNSL